MSTHNLCFYGEITKIILKLFSNTLLIFCSTAEDPPCSWVMVGVWGCFYRRHYDLVSKFNVGLKSPLKQGTSEPKFDGDLVYKFRKNWWSE